MAKKLICPQCGSAFVKHEGDYDYTQLTGLDPTEFELLLSGIELYECTCGTSPSIPRLTALHDQIATTLLSLPFIALRPSALRYLWKWTLSKLPDPRLTPKPIRLRLRWKDHGWEEVES